jgi:hypothetical protein
MDCIPISYMNSSCAAMELESLGPDFFFVLILTMKMVQKS